MIKSRSVNRFGVEKLCDLDAILPHGKIAQCELALTVGCWSVNHFIKMDVGAALP